MEEMIIRERDIILNSMNNKLSDNISKGIRKGRELAQLKTRLFWRMKRDEDRRKFNHTLNDRVFGKREEVRRDHRR